MDEESLFLEWNHLASTKSRSPLTAIRALMDDYAERSVFRGFTARPVRNSIAAFRMLWHRNRIFDLIVDTRKKTIHIPIVLPAVPSSSPLYRNFKAFVASHHAANLPNHRRIERSKARVRCANLCGNVSLTMDVRDADYAYALQRLILLVHEIFLIFLTDGPYWNYMVEHLGAPAEIG